LLRSNNSTQPQADSATHSVQTSKHSAIGIIGSVTSEYQNQLADLNSSFFDVEEANNVNDSMHEDQAAQSPSKTNVVSTQPGFNPDSEAYVWKSLSALPQNVSNSSLATLNTVNSHVPGSSKRPLSNQRGGGHAAGGNLFPYNNVIIAKPPPIGPTARVLLKRGFHQLFYDVSNVRRVGTLVYGVVCMQSTTLFWYCFRFLIAGVFIGIIWYNISNGDYNQRMSLFALSYYYVNIAMGDLLIFGIHERKRTFFRERYGCKDTASSICLSWTKCNIVLCVFQCFRILSVYCLLGS
jgi:hypothetical protein